MSKPRNARNVFVPPPIDGLNLIAPPTEIKATEARQLDNYFIYDYGITQGSGIQGVETYSAGNIGMIYTYDVGNRGCLIAAGQKLYSISSPTGSKTDRTNATAVSSNAWIACQFNNKVVLVNGADTPRVWNGTAASVSDFTGTGSGMVYQNLKMPLGYKGRLYLMEENATYFWYGPLGFAGDAGGTWTQVDVGSFFESGGYILQMFTWTVNQGLSNEDLLVIISSRGEILIYQGDYPGSSTWGLLARGKIPAPVNTQSFVKVSNDVYIRTQRGLIPISSVIQNQQRSDSYYSLSRKIKDELYNGAGWPVISDQRPFLFVIDQSTYYVYVLNYERGAWSRLTFLDDADGLEQIAVFQDQLMLSRGADLYRYDLAGSPSSAVSYVWKTPFFDFGKSLVKESKLIRVLGSVNTLSASDKTFTITASISKDLEDPSSPSEVTAVSPALANSTQTPVVLEVAPPGIGKRLSFVFDREGAASDGIATIQGFDAFFEEGGIY